jgi:UDPglucose 6-dehydrogenase
VLKDKKIAVWGLTFKPDTDDVRSSVAIDVVRDLVSEGAEVTVYDPKGTEKALEFKLIDGARVANSPLEAATGAEALIIATEWKEFTKVDLSELRKVMHTPLIFDGRNILAPETVRAAGFRYTSIGRS